MCTTRENEKMKATWFLWLGLWSIYGASGLVVRDGDQRKVFPHVLTSFGPPSREHRYSYHYEGEVKYFDMDPCEGLPDDPEVKRKFVLFDLSKAGNCTATSMALDVQSKKGLGMLMTEEHGKPWIMQTIDPLEAEEVKIPCAKTSDAFRLYLLALPKKHKLEVHLNTIGDRQVDRGWLDRVLTPLFSLVWSAILGAMLATGALLLVNMLTFAYMKVAFAYMKVRDFFTARWRLQRIRRIPFKHYRAVANAEDEVCIICLDSFQAGDRLTIFPCNHFYHRDCIISWLERSPLCPVCKRDVFDFTDTENNSRHFPTTDTPETETLGSPPQGHVVDGEGQEEQGTAVDGGDDDSRLPPAAPERRRGPDYVTVDMHSPRGEDDDASIDEEGQRLSPED